MAGTLPQVIEQSLFLLQSEPESVCVCRVSKMACGSDGVTYPTICELNEEAARRGKPDKFNPQLLMKYWGPCKEGTVVENNF